MPLVMLAVCVPVAPTVRILFATVKTWVLLSYPLEVTETQELPLDNVGELAITEICDGVPVTVASGPLSDGGGQVALFVHSISSPSSAVAFQEAALKQAPDWQK